jgi:hypothetical protein
MYALPYFLYQRRRHLELILRIHLTRYLTVKILYCYAPYRSLCRMLGISHAISRLAAVILIVSWKYRVVRSESHLRVGNLHESFTSSQVGIFVSFRVRREGAIGSPKVDQRLHRLEFLRL